MKKTLRNPIILWFISLFIILAVGIVFMPREADHPGFFETVYSTLRLFVFERDLPTFPRAWPLVLIYFAAPLVTVSALGTAITYCFKLTPFLKTRGMSNHVVICGVGKNGKLLAGVLKQKGVPVVGIDLGPPEDFEEWSTECRIPVFFGDFNSALLLEKARASRARSIIFSSGDDLANLEGALGAYDDLKRNHGPVCLIWTHIASEALADIARDMIRTGGKVGIRIFDLYRIAASNAVARHFDRRVRQGKIEVNILGFGKFGRDFTEMLIRDMTEEERFSIRVVDVEDRENAVRELVGNTGMADRVVFQQSAIQDLHWVEAKDRAFILCTDDDLGNLTLAMSLVKKAANTTIHVRMSHWPLSAVAGHLCEAEGLVFINVIELVSQGLPEIPGLFEAARPSDLKRVDVASCCTAPENRSHSHS